MPEAGEQQTSPGTAATGAAASSNAPLEALGAIRFLCPKAFAGRDENWEIFAIRLRNYMMQASVKFQKLMKDAKEADSEIDFDLYDGDEKLMAIQLQSALVALCEGSSQKIVNRDEDCVNGFETWRRLWLRYTVQKRQKATTRMTKVLQWNFKCTQQDFENDFEDWEAEIDRYRKEQGKDIPSDVLI